MPSSVVQNMKKIVWLDFQKIDQVYFRDDIQTDIQTQEGPSLLKEGPKEQAT